ncbi:hypothetical protein KVH15_37110 [Streptomyces olivaceus]|uniref:hypothetical protein n=1 Tax=Streptomyces olivaceus TaxID=47716 RepID=UPI001CCE2248|nr:hypothetical protein [Streptomyces olivaceus]MBZ6086592.1 hypothetical protein [Streptomyces olivaceus]
MTAEHDAWNALDIRRPGDVPAFTPLTWLLEKETEHSHRLGNNALPTDFPHQVERGTAADALAALALREAVRRRVDQERAVRVREALTLGATWSQLAAALDVTPDEARALLRDWAEGQHQLHRGDVADGRPRPFGLDDQAHAAVLALCELDDDQAAAVPAGTA